MGDVYWYVPMLMTVTAGSRALSDLVSICEQERRFENTEDPSVTNEGLEDAAAKRFPGANQAVSQAVGSQVPTGEVTRHESPKSVCLPSGLLCLC